jgi:hypothetical protein
VIAEYTVVSQAEIDTARAEWEQANEDAQALWAQAEAAELWAEQLRDQWARLACQRGFVRAVERASA